LGFQDRQHCGIISALTQVEFVWGISFAADELFMKDDITDRRSHLDKLNVRAESLLQKDDLGPDRILK